MSNRDYIVAYFMSRGLTRAQAAGIAGNFMQESSDNPNAPGGGLDQGQGGRYHPGTLQQQLDAIWNELLTSERGSLQALRGTRTPEEAARVFSEHFERPGEPMIANRERYAREAYGGGGSTQDASFFFNPNGPLKTVPGGAAIEELFKKGLPGGGANPITDVLSIGEFLAKLTKTEFWIKVGKVLVGLFLLLAGVMGMANVSAPDPTAIVTAGGKVKDLAVAAGAL